MNQIKEAHSILKEALHRFPEYAKFDIMHYYLPVIMNAPNDIKRWLALISLEKDINNTLVFEKSIKPFDNCLYNQ